MGTQRTCYASCYQDTKLKSPQGPCLGGASELQSQLLDFESLPSCLPETPVSVTLSEASYLLLLGILHNMVL